jgi:N-acetylmuramoyl-L-alanine amidase
MKRRGIGFTRLMLLPALLCLGIGPAAAKDGSAAQHPDLNCLALNIYHEARGEPFEGRLAVAHVVLNRVADRRFPRTICAVVKQGGWQQRHRCHFSWWCDGRSDRPTDARAWRESQMIARLVHDGLTLDPTNGALWYHARHVSPYWADSANKLRHTKIGAHIFYLANEETRRKVTPETGT